MTEKEFNEKWGGISTDDMTDEQFMEFKVDCFEMYETEGFIDRFDSPYDDIGGGEHEHNGMKFEVVRRANLNEADLEAMPMWFIRFENGDEAYCYPEEICKAEHRG